MNTEHFPKHNKTTSGLDSWCKSCRSSYRSETRRGQYRNMISDNQLKDIIDNVKECVICGSEENLVVDHCHKTNTLRGMLCNHCNRGLGHFRDDPELLEFARIYLLANSQKKEDINEYNNYINYI